MRERHGGDPELLARLKVRAVNVLSAIHSQIYFPTHANDLKSVAGCLGFRWSDADASGLQSIVWLHAWEQAGIPPRLGGASGRSGSEAFNPSAGNAGLAKFLADHNTGQRWDLAVTSAMSAGDLVATDNVSVMALGGFSGSDPAATVASVATMVERGAVRYFLTGNGFGRGGAFRLGGAPSGSSAPTGFGGFGRGGTAGQIMQAVQAVCTPVTAGATDGKATLPSAYDGQLYDCARRGPALAARSS